VLRDLVVYKKINPFKDLVHALSTPRRMESAHSTAEELIQELLDALQEIDPSRSAPRTPPAAPRRPAC
jgi:hypothetical protein